ncbi:uncharacterized protein BBOV_IV002130 [Babesia bovis T2Bo]|uniref:Uncharacterized protein n=1 Tax=Babesia bovis TaxID=5865 RepID=A7AVI4_BABBO|nr:uncharacterized protein BBOV_IV002130 [Babesia bovis T2Bo]EDO05810.1 hypothetical protein BBOV_IV002130 [Babesia bovis T2Bo]|eukprot:XP_001609378.1 hypothetical protein [Babesia bovis T2Bo]
MLPQVNPKHDGEFLDYTPNDGEFNVTRDLVGETYPLEPLVLGESAVNFRSSDIYGSLNDPYKQEIVGMEPSYLADWKGSKWNDVSTPTSYQDTCPSIGSTQFSIDTSYGEYMGGYSLSSHDKFASSDSFLSHVNYNMSGMFQHQDSSASTTVFNLTTGGGNETGLYGVGEFNNMKDVNSYTSYVPSVSDGYDTLDHLVSMDTTTNTVCGSYEMPSIHFPVTEGAPAENLHVDSHTMQQISHMGDSNIKPEPMAMMNTKYLSALTQQFLGPVNVDITPNRNKVSTADISSYAALLRDLEKSSKNKESSDRKGDKGSYAISNHRVVRRLNSTSDLSGPTIGTKRSMIGPYDSSGSTKSPNFRQYVQSDSAYTSGDTTKTSTPTTRHRLSGGRRNALGNRDTNFSMSHNASYPTFDMDTMSTEPVESNVMYLPSNITSDAGIGSHYDRSVAGYYHHGGVDPSAEGKVMQSRHSGHLDAMDRLVKREYIDPPAGDTHVVDFSSKLVEKSNHHSKGLQMTNSTTEDYFGGTVDGLNNFKGVLETFRDDENSQSQIDPSILRQSLEGNRYIEDLANQYDLNRSEAVTHDTYVYLRTKNSGEFGGASLQKHRVVTDPVATSTELNEILLKCASEKLNFLPTITWDESQQAHVVTWWSSKEDGTLEKQVRSCPAGGCGKAAAYEEALRVAMYAETQIKPGDLIRWYPGFNIPIGTSGRTNLRKVLHMVRMKNAELCDPVLAANGMKIATKSTFGDMTIVELYKAAYVLGLWDVAAYNCLKTCKRRGCSYLWIYHLQLINRRVTLDSLKYLRDLRESMNVQRQSKRSSRGSTRSRVR